MEEAIKKIIEMLEKGKIKVEEAERLIRAIKESAEEREKGYEFFDFRWISEMIKRSIKDAIRWGFIFQKIKGVTEIPVKDTVKIETYNGNIEIISQKRDNIKIIADYAGIEEKENEIAIYSSKEDIEILIPEEKVPLIVARSYNGEIETKGKFKKLEIESYSGDIYVNAEFDEIKINTYNGNSEIITKRNPIKINLSTYEGEIELPEGFKKEGNTYIYGEGEYKKINFESYNGDFELKFKEE